LGACFYRPLGKLISFFFNIQDIHPAELRRAYEASRTPATPDPTDVSYPPKAACTGLASFPYLTDLSVMAWTFANRKRRFEFYLMKDAPGRPKALQARMPGNMVGFTSGKS
jgi:hypothetical protein